MAAAPCMSLMGSKKLATSSIVALGVIVVVMGLCQVQEAYAAAAIEVINLSLVPVNVTASVIGSDQAPISVTVGVGANVTLPLQLTTSATLVKINVTITNLPNNASRSAIVTVSANATSTILITPALVPFILNKVNAVIGNLVGLVFSLLPLPPINIVVSL